MTGGQENTVMEQHQNGVWAPEVHDLEERKHKKNCLQIFKGRQFMKKKKTYFVFSMAKLGPTNERK